MKIVLMIISGLRRDHVRAYGNSWLPTEGFDALASAGKVWTQARCADADPAATRVELLTGLARERFRRDGDFYHVLEPGATLPARLRAAGYHAALLTDNFPRMNLYQHWLTTFDTVHIVSGQGADPCVSDVSAAAAGVFDTVVSGSDHVPASEELSRYARNHSQYSRLGHPSARLFDALRTFLERPSMENTFILVDSYGLQPPWNAPPEFRRFRGGSGENALAWPTSGPVNAADAEVQKQLNFLRRAYADGCLFMDHLIGTIRAEDVNLIVLSDQGVLIGDEDFLLGRPDQAFPALVEQVLITRAPGMEGGTRPEVPIRPMDIYASVLGAARPDHFAGGDGERKPLFD